MKRMDHINQLLIFIIASQVPSRVGQKWRMDGRGALALGQHLPLR